MSVLWTEEKIEEYKKDPISLAYDSGHAQGWNDRSWDSKKPRVFSKDDCPSYRKGYCDGWAAASSFYVNEGGEIDDDISDEQRNYWIEGELSIIKFWEKNHAECSDEDCIPDEDAKKSWLEVVECMERIFVSDNKKRGEAK